MNKKKILVALSIAALLFASCSETVYVCTGTTAKAYHKSDQCVGLNRCKGEIVEMPKKEAEKVRRPCGICYSTKHTEDEN